MKPATPGAKSKRWHELSVLVVGCGSIGLRHVRVLRSLGVVDLRIAEPLAARRALVKSEEVIVAEYADLAAGLADRPDAAIICTPPRLHIEQASLTLQKGVHVFLEKPLAETLAQVRGLRQTIRASRRVFAVGYCMRHHEALSRAKQQVDAGRV
ncbi:MAG: Gfo/Idh/MocA family oxidoreductase, partial [Verrucomicrobia bacterium]|nr:Gfo/Idh/MocA family oxidoreductase [Verrucomicrobiota bacterium]